eukprot:TCONS_00027510-protein
MDLTVHLDKGRLKSVQVQRPKLSSIDDVIIEVTHAGVCGTDLKIIDGKFPAAETVIMGHEITGLIAEKGENVTHLSIGDRVCVNPFNFCSTCLYCVRGDTQFCVREGMKTAFGIMKDGGWQKYVVVPGSLCFQLPQGMSLQDSVFCQPLSNCIRGWDNMVHVDLDARILVAGAGIVGLLWASLFHFHGYRDVTITEVIDHRKLMASRLDLGFPALKPGDVNREMREAEEHGNEAWGFDLIVDCTGQKEAIETQFKWLRKGATFLLYGVCAQGVNLDLEVYQIYKKEITIVSSYLNRFSYARTLKLVHGMSKRYLDFKKLDVGVFKLKDYEEALEKLQNGEFSKLVFEV